MKKIIFILIVFPSTCFASGLTVYDIPWLLWHFIKSEPFIWLIIFLFIIAFTFIIIFIFLFKIHYGSKNQTDVERDNQGKHRPYK